MSPYGDSFLRTNFVGIYSTLHSFDAICPLSRFNSYEAVSPWSPRRQSVCPIAT